MRVVSPEKWMDGDCDCSNIGGRVSPRKRGAGRKTENLDIIASAVKHHN